MYKIGVRIADLIILDEIKRVDMPQISSADFNNLILIMNEIGVSFQFVSLDIDRIIPIQEDANKQKVENISNEIQKGKKLNPIIISSDFYIIDGHHRYLAHINLKKEKIDCFQIGYPKLSAFYLYSKISKKINKSVNEEKTIEQLYNQTPKKIKNRSTDVLAKLNTITKQGRFLYTTTTISNGNSHTCYIRPMTKKGSLNLNPKKTDYVIVWCDCNHFLFNLETSLHKTNASRIVNSNGKNPIIMNPKMKKFLCKHLLSAYDDYINKIERGKI
jgi:hypothetical protein